MGKLRTDGYNKALSQNGIPFDENLIIKIENVENCEIIIAKLLEAKAIDAVFAVNELFAVTIIKIANKMGLKVPEDVAVIAFTDGIISKYSTQLLPQYPKTGLKWEIWPPKILIERLESEGDEDQEDDHEEKYKTV